MLSGIRPSGLHRGLLAALLVLVGGGTGLALISESTATPELAAPPPPRPIAWATVVAADAAPIRAFAGILQARQQAPISFEVPGRLATVTVDIGDTFGAGDVLATLDTRSFELALEERRSELAEADAAAAEAEAAFDRQRRLYGEGWASRAAYDRALAALETARSRVGRAQARLAIAEEDHADTILTAPYPGRVARRLAEPSQQVAAGEPVLQIHGQDGLEVQVAVPETVVHQLIPGSRHDIALAAGVGHPMTGVIAEIAAEATDRNAFPVTLTLIDPPRGLRAGLTAEVALTLHAEAGQRLVGIPVGAFAAGSGADHVAYVFDPVTSTVARRTITIADIGGEQVLVSEGLSAGEIVATAGLSFLHDGEAVALLGNGPSRYNR